MTTLITDSQPYCTFVVIQHCQQPSLKEKHTKGVELLCYYTIATASMTCITHQTPNLWPMNSYTNLSVHCGKKQIRMIFFPLFFGCTTTTACNLFSFSQSKKFPPLFALQIPFFFSSFPCCIFRCVHESLYQGLSVGPSVGPLVRWSVGPSVHWSVCPLVRLSVGPSVGWSVSPSVRHVSSIIAPAQCA